MIGLFNRLLASFGLAAVIAAQALGPPAAAEPLNTGHLKAELVAQTTSVAPGQTTHVALTQDIQKGWHTYWRNSGDSGEATVIKWTLPPGWTAGDIIWAPPSREPTGPLMNYGYHGQVLLPVEITAPKTARPGQTVTLQADVQFLVCADLCVPEDAKLTLTLPVTAAPGGPDPAWGGKIAQALDAAPRADGLTAVVAKDPKALKLAIVGAPLKALDKADAYFFPFKSNIIDHAKPQVIERGPDGLTLTMALPATPPADTEYAQVGGVLELAGKAYEVAAVPGPLPAGASGLGAPAARPAPGAAGGFQMGLLAAVAFAFIGGLILNLMPCVFPILAMKAASLAGHGHDRREAQVQGLAFLAGSVATFMALAGLLIAVRTAGAAVGWGFQLQSPPVVAVLALLMLAVALNLSGLFEVGSSLQGVGGQAASRGGVVGSFFTGALAVVVAAPCTAPFMGPALGWALVQPPAAALAVFAGLGLGFAAPFTAAAFAPGLLSSLPKPGAWMDGFRKLMSFPMYGTAAWLAWVLTVQTDPTGLARLFAAAIVLALGVWLLGVAQRRQSAGSGALAPALTGLVLAAIAIGAAVWPKYDEPAVAGAPSAEGAAIAAEPYSPEKLAAAQAAGKPVFVNYTAAWCVTCQVNEKVAFSTKRAADAFARSGAVYLKADWTRRDAAIAADLAHFGRAGVPLYLVYSAKGGEPAVLPQLLTGDIVAAAIEKAAGG